MTERELVKNLGLLFIAAFIAVSFYMSLPKQTKPSDLIHKKLIPSEWFYLQRSFPNGSIPYEQYFAAIEQKQAMAMQKFVSSGEWTLAGPDNIGGRITAVEADYNNPATIFVSAAAGGVLKSTDGGVTWKTLTDYWPSLSVGALAMDPVNPEILYCGTGEANISTDSYPGFGMIKTTDGGQTWKKSGLDSTRHIADIEIHPLNRNSIFVAASGGLYSKGPHRGVYRSTNSGESWTRVLFVNDSTSAIDIAVDPEDTSRVYAAVWERLRGPSFRKAAGISSGIFVSNDGGWTWARLGNGLPAQNASTGRIAISVAPSNPNYIYALYQDGGSANGTIGQFNAFYRSTNRGANWTKVSSSTEYPYYSNFGWYFGLLKVSPFDHMTVFAGGIDLFVTTDAGSSWSNTTNSYSGTWDMQHPDQHALWFHPSDPNKMYNGNDGGFFFTNNAGTTWSKRYNLPVSQFYAATIDYLTPANLYGGLQDNGSVGTQTGSTSDWSEFLGGDGFVSQVDYTNSNTIYMEWQNGGLARSTDKGQNYSSITNGLDLSRTNWCSPYILDPVNAQTLYFGSYKLFKSTNRGDNWAAISPDLTRGANGRMGTITAIAASATPTNSRYLYVATDDGKISVSSNAGANWIDRTGSLPRRYMTDVLADKNNPETAYLCISGYNLDEPLPHVYRTTDAGVTWISISSNLPSVPVNSIIIDYTRDSTLYVGTDAGVFYSLNLGKSWQILGNGLPNAPVSDLVFHQPTRKLYAATHGRSIFVYDTQNLITSANSDISYGKHTFSVKKNFPNPFNAQTRIAFELPQPGFVSFQLYNVSGEAVLPVITQLYEKGTNYFSLDAGSLRSGIYFCRVSFGKYSETLKLALIK